MSWFYWPDYVLYREGKPGFFARLKRKKNAATDDDHSRRQSANQVDPAAFPDVKARRSTLPPLYPTKEPAQSELAREGDDPEETGRRRRRKRRTEDSEDGDERRMSSLRDLPPLNPSAGQQQDQRRRRLSNRQPVVYEDNEDDFWVLTRTCGFVSADTAADDLRMLG